MTSHLVVSRIHQVWHFWIYDIDTGFFLTKSHRLPTPIMSWIVRFIFQKVFIVDATV